MAVNVGQASCLGCCLTFCFHELRTLYEALVALRCLLRNAGLSNVAIRRLQLHLLGLDHERLTYRYAGRDYRLTDVSGHVVREVLA